MPKIIKKKDYLCSGCKYFVRLIQDNDGEQGRCYQYPPARNVTPGCKSYDWPIDWPIVKGRGWCGEYEG